MGVSRIDIGYDTSKVVDDRFTRQPDGLARHFQEVFHNLEWNVGYQHTVIQPKQNVQQGHTLFTGLTKRESGILLLSENAQGISNYGDGRVFGTIHGMPAVIKLDIADLEDALNFNPANRGLFVIEYLNHSNNTSLMPD